MKNTSKILVQTLLFTLVVVTFIYGNNLFRQSSTESIRVVGSSIVYPFISYIAETVASNDKKTNIIIETTGTGTGFKLFCQTTDPVSQPDIVAASRIITNTETKLCKQHGIEPIEILFGYDAMLLLTSGTKLQNITRKELFLALAEFIPSGDRMIKNPFQYWDEINPSLPHTLIEVYGPPHSSGTRDELNKLVMNYICKKIPLYQKHQNESLCSSIRQDGKYIETGDNENLTIQKIKFNSNALAILGYNFYIGNQDLHPLKIDNIYPNIKNITSFQYPLTRPLYLYFNTKKKKTLKDFMLKLISHQFFNNNSKLMNIGLIPLKQEQLKELNNKILTASK